MRGLAAFLVRNWPLKIAALALATLLYTGLALSQGADVFRERIPIFPENQPEDAVLLTPLSELVVTSVSYVATRDVGTLSADDFRATIDLSGVDPAGGPESVPVRVRSLVPGIVVSSVVPQRVQVELDPLVERTVPVMVDLGPPPVNSEVGTPTADPAAVTVAGAQSVVEQVVGARATVPLDPNGLDFGSDVQLIPVDRDGRELQVDVSPQKARITVPVTTPLRQRTLPVNPVMTGNVPSGIRIESIDVTPSVVTVEGDADDLATLTAADTVPISLSGVSEDLDREVALALPERVRPVEVVSVRVVVRLEAVTDTRSFGAAIRVVGGAPGMSVSTATTRVLVALFGPVSLLDEVGNRPLLATADAVELGPGQHEVRLQVTDLPSGVSVADISPPTVIVTVVDLGSPSPTPPAAATPSP